MRPDRRDYVEAFKAATGYYPHGDHELEAMEQEESPMTEFTRVELQAILKGAKGERARLEETHRASILYYRESRDALKTTIREVEVALRKIDREERQR